MPELPEVEAHAERLDRQLAGAELAAFEPLAPTALKTLAPADGGAGHRLVYVGRRGKHLLLDFGELTFVIHLMQGGRLRLDTGRARRPRGGLARWRFTDGRALLLSEAGSQKRAGVWVVTGDPEEQPPLAGLGPDADAVTDEVLGERLRARGGRLHTALRDQRVIAGIGRRLANEICHRAGLSPFQRTGELTDEQVALIGEAVRAVINESLAYERGRDDMSSSAERPGRVHNRGGEPCATCGTGIRSVAYRDYTIWYCPGCQTGGRILADNTTSRFLR